MGDQIVHAVLEGLDESQSKGRNRIGCRVDSCHTQGVPKTTLAFVKKTEGIGIETRMTTSISSEARRNQTSILIRGRENHVSPKPDGQTDISIYRVASLLNYHTPFTFYFTNVFLKCYVMVLF